MGHAARAKRDRGNVRRRDHGQLPSNRDGHEPSFHTGLPWRLIRSGNRGGSRIVGTGRGFDFNDPSTASGRGSERE